MSQIVTFELISVLAFQPSPILPDFTTAILPFTVYDGDWEVLTAEIFHLRHKRQKWVQVCYR